MFTSILTSADSLIISEAMICTALSLILGLIVSLVYIYSGRHSKNLAITLVLLPVLVQVVLMMVNGNLGTGVAVMGAFGLIRFRSIPGSSKDIVSIFFSMAIGLSTAMGYATFAITITVLISLVLLILSKSSFGEIKTNKVMRIIIPENLDYTEVFDDLFEKYTENITLERVKTTNLGSMYELTYNLTIKDIKMEKALIDELRCRNGNLPIISARSQILLESEL